MVQRKDRVESELLRTISQLVQKEIRDPEMGFVTFLGTRVSKDLRNASIYYSVLGDDIQKERTEAIIKKSTKYLKKLVNDHIKLRYAIDLKFVRETILDESFRVEEILNKIFKEKEQEGDKP